MTVLPRLQHCVAHAIHSSSYRSIHLVCVPHSGLMYRVLSLSLEFMAHNLVKQTRLSVVRWLTQEVKELVRGTRQAVGSNFLGSLESFLVYLESLMEYCKLFLADETAEAVMKVWYIDYSDSACSSDTACT